MEKINKLKVLYPAEAFWTQRGGYANSSSMHHIIRENFSTCLSREKSKKIFNMAIRHGTLYEELALKYICHKYKSKVHNVGSVKHPQYDFIRATPDGLAIINGKYTSIEVKCPVNPARMFAKVPEYVAQCNTASLCCETEQILYSRFLFVEEESKWQKYKGFKKADWKKDALAFGWWNGFWRTDYEYFFPEETHPEPPKNAILFKLAKVNEEFRVPEDILTPNLESIKKYVKLLRDFKRPSENQLINIKLWLKLYANLPEDKNDHEAMSKIFNQLLTDCRLI